MDKLLSIREASRILGVSNGTLRRWEKESRLVPERTAGGQRRYPLSALRPHLVRTEKIDRKTLCYARVSSHDQRQDLERQKQVLEMYCAAQGWKFETIADLGSGMNYNKKGLKILISAILDREAGRLVLTHKDRLLRFGAELIFSICEMNQVEVVIINQGKEPSFEEELAKDVLEIITVFSARLYGARSKKNKKLLEGLKEAYDAVSS
ncbi:IS607 family transposase (plasmid) [Candidatus Bealeia paramacronuclearis]|uniref:S607 family transposase n=1 Tax=Candidatus Bealeia paramacronuclearis TaxID=1921001 RepID=A0ABZ2C3M2_9PROT|nr:IS607 family transposase [Candidatus Bealeia paramacronuclearis]MEB3701716.1 IS607 family transposase [Candidatus Bealeia paramacronuclearis]MEB3701907.1 IS607 family transposase [Candidatus Bealeia paramacronuclearis]MEB3702163.1 IS607 family transposase [Candidatus Bealeia paramacronuclearis]MEB3702490.1 IS607 family transposase [Candidatus Bealeia paramacronuclearis]